MGRFFVNRPIFAAIVSIVMTIIGLVAYFQLPIEQYPQIAPPSIVVSASYPGADAETIAATVATPLEQEVNGVEGMLYLSSYSTADGSMSLTITFKLGTDLDVAQVLVQNRVSAALPRLPQEVRNLGVTTTKSSPDLMMVVHMLSPDETFDQLYVSNYARARVRDRLVRLDGVGNLLLFGEREFSARVWLDPDRLASLSLTAGDVVNALREQNVQVSGRLSRRAPQSHRQRVPDFGGRPPAVCKPPRNSAASSSIPPKRVGSCGCVTWRGWRSGRGPMARIPISTTSPPSPWGFSRGPDQTRLRPRMRSSLSWMSSVRISRQGLEYQVVYNPTAFISASINAVYTTIAEAVILVVIVIMVFLQSWRMAVIPLVAIPISLIGTFAIMLALGFTLNLLTLFGLILAIGIVVDDAIVVVENVERNIQGWPIPARGVARHDGRSLERHRRYDAGADRGLHSLGLRAGDHRAVLHAVRGDDFGGHDPVGAHFSEPFRPRFRRCCCVPADAHGSKNPISRLFDAFGRGFNRAFDAITAIYARIIAFLVRSWATLCLSLLVYFALLGSTVLTIQSVPTGFIPETDQGYAIVVVQLPDGASLERTDEVIKQATEIALETPGVKNAVAFAGFSGATFTNASNQGVIFTAFESFEDRGKAGLPAGAIVGSLFGRMQVIREAFIIAIAPPSVRGVGTGGGFKLQLQEKESADMGRVLGGAYAIMGAAQQSDKVTGVFTTFSASSPQVFLDIDRVRAQILNVPIGAIFETLAINLGSAYVNDFNAYGRLFQVRAQADEDFRLENADIANLKVRSATGALIPLGTLVEIRDTAGPVLVQRYNQLVSVPVQGSAAPGISTGEALIEMEKLADAVLPPGIDYEWTELALQERSQGNTAAYIFALSVLLAFLFLAALYESLTLPFAIILIVPLSILAAPPGRVVPGNG